MKRTAVASSLVRLGLAVALVAIAWIAALPAIPPGSVPASAPQGTGRSWDGSERKPS
jgi:hypothetical protein